MRTKKCGAYIALAAVLLIAAALITSCIDPLGPGGLTVPQSGAPADFTPPTPVSTPISTYTPVAFDTSDPEPVEKVGYIQLKISIPESGARTIMPDTSDIAELADFTNFNIYILQADGTTVVGSPTTVIQSALATPITLAAGTYKVRVFGNVSGNAVATGISETVTITSSTGGTANITLGEIVGDPIPGTTSHGNGTFTWAFTNPGGVEEATMIIEPLSTGGTDTWDGTDDNPYGDLVDIPELTNSTGIALKSGYYRVSIALAKDGTKSETQMSILHIYQGFTSHYAVPLKTLKPNRYTVTFYYNDGYTTGDPSPVYGTPITNVLHGDRLLTSQKPTDPVNRAHNTWVFGEWFTEPATTTAVTFGTSTTGTVVIRNLDLYAKWTDPATLGVSINVENDVEWAADGSPVLSASVTSWDRNSAVADIAITVSNRTNFTSLSWKIDGTTATPTITGTDGEIFTFGLTSDSMKILGKYTIYVEAIDSDSKHWSSELELTVHD